jgi:hypothetical protein
MQTKVYFLQAGNGPIKIGYSGNPLKRLKLLQNLIPMRLRILATQPGGREEEARLHRKFDDLRLEYGEWFDPEYRLMEYINSIKKTHSCGAK